VFGQQGLLLNTNRTGRSLRKPMSRCSRGPGILPRDGGLRPGRNGETRRPSEYDVAAAVIGGSLLGHVGGRSFRTG
jgi:hypothetical protein